MNQPFEKVLPTFTDMLVHINKSVQVDWQIANLTPRISEVRYNVKQLSSIVDKVRKK